MSRAAIPVAPAYRRRSVLLIVSDRPNPGMTGGGRHPDVKTPALDGLARRGTMLSSSCRCPAGRVAHDLGNGALTPGSAASYGRALVAAGYPVTAIGALPAREADDIAFVDRRLAVLRHPRPVSEEGGAFLTSVGPGESPYTRFDRAVAAAAVGYLRDETQSGPWALIVSFASPRFPLVAPKDLFDRYDPTQLTLPPPETGPRDRPEDDPSRRAIGGPLTESHQRAALHAYLALCSFLDARIGQVLQALEASGQAEDTVVVYTADHGKSAPAHGLWLERLVSDGAGGMPVVAAGPGVEQGRVVETPVSHSEVAASILGWMGTASSASAVTVPPARAPGIALGERR